MAIQRRLVASLIAISSTLGFVSPFAPFHRGTFTSSTTFLSPYQHQYDSRAQPIRQPEDNTRNRLCHHPQIGSHQLLNMVQGDTGGNDNDLFVKADDGEALQALFSKQCDDDGLMTKDMLVSVPAIAELLELGDLLAEELDDIWTAAPKFPDVDSTEERIDVDSFIQIYRDVDDIFEDDETEETTESPSAAVTSEESVDSDDEEKGEDDDVKELEQAFNTICDESSLVSKAALKSWTEIQELIEEGMLGEDEFEQLWKQTVNDQSSTDKLDMKGFLSFNSVLDELFEFENDDDDVMNEEEKAAAKALAADSLDDAPEKTVIYGDDLPPGVLFAEICDDDFQVGEMELKRWGDLQDMLKEGDLLPIELQNIFDQVPKAPGTKDKINEDGFLVLFDTIESLFEDDEDLSEDDRSGNSPPKTSKKDKLFTTLSELELDTERLPCGLEGTESEMKRVLDIVSALETEPDNLVISSEGEIDPTAVAGDWELLYTSSSTMKFNKGLSGLVPPNGRFGGLVQKLEASKYLANVEYIEQINAGPASFEVRVTGDWELKSSVSLFTGAKSVALLIEPDKVAYGPTTSRADHWKSLGPMNLLDITYLDENLRIMRGTTSTDTVFIFRRS